MENKVFILKNKKEEIPGIFILKFVPEKGTVFYFKAGQFAIFNILKEGFFEIPSRAYTITSLMEDEFLTITVKMIGRLSNALCGLEVGDRVGVTGPYGEFYPTKLDRKDIIFLAGGIGITPFYSIIRSYFQKDENRKITLFYSNKTEKDVIFFKELNKIKEKLKNLEIIYVLTRSDNKSLFAKEFKRIDVEMINKYIDNLNDENYFICGPNDFVKDLGAQLKSSGVEGERIKTEVFY